MSGHDRKFPRVWESAPLCFLALVLLLFTSLAKAQESLADLAPFREGCQALADERFATAVTRFRECWDLLQDGETGGPEGNFVAARLLEALVRDGDSPAAVGWVLKNEGFQPTPLTSYWIAAAFQAVNRFSEAADYYQLHLAATPDAPSATIINRAVCLARSRQTDAAFDLVHEKVQPSGPGETLRLAQIAASASHWTEALTFIEGIDLADPAWTGLRLPLARLRGALQARSGDRGGALETVSQLIETSTDAGEARLAFLLLEALLAEHRPADLEAKLASWEQDETFAGREVAALFLLILFGEESTRAERLRAFAATATDPALKLEAELRLAEANAPAAPDKPTIPGDLRDRIAFAAASGAYTSARFEEAARKFSALAEASGGEAAARHFFNAAVSSLRHDDATAFAAFEEALARNNPRSGRLADLSYLGGLYFAAKGDPSAFDRLNRFVQEHPDHPANIDARLALAEIHINQAPARPRAAREIFESLRTRPLTLAQSERLDYTSVWVELTDGNATELHLRAGEFVGNWPSSGYLSEVLMILASEQYSRKNLTAAAASFRRVSEEFPDSPHKEAARFFEAKASPASGETVAKWRQLIAGEGPFADEAAHELGMLFLSMDRFDEARAELAALLERLAPESPLRYAVMADLAYAYYLEALSDGRDTTKLAEAADRFAALSNLASAPALWRYNAAVRRGKCLEALGKATVALEIYRSIVDETRSGSEGATAPLAPEETEWVFRAGFAAIEILNAEKNWATAIEVADALSEKSGPRAIEATRLAERLRLKHWVWD